jgi:hypothetical protein
MALQRMVFSASIGAIMAVLAGPAASGLQHAAW